MPEASRTACVAFIGSKLVASGSIEHVAVAARRALDAEADGPLLIFDAVTSEPVELDLRGSPDEVERRTRAVAEAELMRADRPATQDAHRGPGRPRLGVVAREVTLLPRHWEWLATQPGGASAVLRRLVDGARRTHADQDRIRAAQESAYRFMQAMAGNEPGFEEAIRGLFVEDLARVHACTESWPPDVRDHARRLAHLAAAGPAEAGAALADPEAQA